MLKLKLQYRDNLMRRADSLEEPLMLGKTEGRRRRRRQRMIWLDGIADSVQFIHSAVSHSLGPHELQHARPPCPTAAPGVYSNSCPLSR